MARTKAEPSNPITSYVPPDPPRAIVVADCTNAFADTVYQLGLEPGSAWRAVSVEQAKEMQATWQAGGIASFIVAAAEMLRGSDEDETPSEEAESKAEAA